MSERGDAALETLMLPLLDGSVALSQPTDALFLRARSGWPLRQLPGIRWHATQSFKPLADALLRDGIALADDSDDARYPLVLVLPPRQRDEARATLARALARVAPGGTLLACMANAEGARSGEADLARLAGPVRSLSKHKCRVFWIALDDARIDPGLLAQWTALDAPRPILDGRFVSRPGLFAWDRIDAASALLAAHLPTDLSGHGADLGAGFGYLAAQVLATCPGVQAFDLYEAEARALELARINLAPCATRVALNFHWHDVSAGLLARYDFIVSNPPFHIGASPQVDLGRAFIASAAAALRPGGRLWLVANRQLPYEAVLGGRFDTVRTLAQEQGYKVICAVKGSRA